MSTETQRRQLPGEMRAPRLIERAEGGGLPMITGYAAVFYREGDAATEYEIWPADSYGPRIVERILPGAFDRAVKDDDVRALFDHNSAAILGRSGAGTLRLSVDATGLKYEIDPPNTTAARDLIESLRRGDVKGSSFAFIPRDTSRRDVAASGGKPAELVLERRDVQLFDVGPVTFPAYAGTTSGVRSADAEAVHAEVSKWRARQDFEEFEMFAVALTEEI